MPPENEIDFRSANLIATVRFFPTELGGRKSPTPGRIFRTVLTINENNLSAALILGETGSIFPGQTVKIPILFLDWEYARTFCTPGKRFFVREINTIGEGFIEELLS